MNTNPRSWGGGIVASMCLPALFFVAVAHAGDQPAKYRGLLGKDDKRVIIKDGKTLLWAGGDPDHPDQAQWYDFTGSPIPAEELQFGIGKDAIPSINDPLFVKPNDRRLMSLSKSQYRPNEQVERIDDIRVIGYVVDGEARAYPTALLDRHELVNDTIAGKPVTVGW
jgi:hypothetical protein